jgi:small subunit ribosomal protein S8
MAITDPIADMLTRIRNASKARFKSVDVPGAKLKIEIAKILKKEGYIKDYKYIEDDKQGTLQIFLKYEDGKTGVIFGLKRISKPGRRIYVKSSEIKPVLNGMGISILSTSSGLMTDKMAIKGKLGGELICNIW